MKNYLLKQIYRSAFYPLLFVLALWIVFFFQSNTMYNFTKWGVLPREISGLRGIITSVFIHGDLGHIASNTIPVLVLGMLLFYFYRKIARSVFFWIWLISGLWLWIGGRNDENYPTYHIGASTLVYGLATFLFFSGIFRRHLPLMAVSSLVVFLYGSIMWGIFPLKTEISWEGHLFGAIAGVLVAFSYRKDGPKRKVYVWEEETEDDNTVAGVEEFPSEEKLSPPPTDPFTFNFIYKKNEEDQKST
ncbi:MAG: rhomboid family intramembrane serine protease [bacterium]|nr:rhomboid family intramembrane serine protease [bacterium]